MKLLYTIFFVITLSQSCTVRSNEDAIRSYIYDFMATRSESDRNRALGLSSVVYSESLRNNVDPLLTAMIISLESSWRSDVTGDGIDHGLMQVRRGGVCARGQDLTTPHGQIKAGVECLALSREQCSGSLEQTLTMYASGKCVSKSVRTKRKIRYRIALFERLKGEYHE